VFPFVSGHHRANFIFLAVFRADFVLKAQRGRLYFILSRGGCAQRLSRRPYSLVNGMVFRL
jgi:hypothetical protein